MTNIFYTDVTSNNIDYNKFISENRKNKIKNYKSEHNKKLSAFCEILLYEALGKTVEVCYPDIGKPYIKNSALNFNFSHSGNISVCAVSDKPIGVDIEKVRDINLEIAARFFTDSEYRRIITDKNREYEFLKYWTLKESYLKYIGTGLKRKLNSFEISVEDKITVYDKMLLDNLNFASFDIDEYIISACFEEAECVIKPVKFDKFINKC